MHRRRRRAPLRASGRSAALRAQLRARAEQLAAVEDLAARNAHYEVLWDLIVDGADNIAYRLALTTLVARQRIASVEGRRGRRASSRDVDGDPRARRRDRRRRRRHAPTRVARDLLERSIPAG